MRSLIPFLLLPAWLPAVADTGFAGAWTASLCADGAARKAGACSTFVLELMEKDGKLCGVHMFATPGATQVDEGAIPSLTGEVAQAKASAVAISRLSGVPVRVPVELGLEGERLRWKRLEPPDGNSLLPEQATLTRSPKRTLFAPLFEQELRTACVTMFNLASQSAPFPASKIPASEAR